MQECAISYFCHRFLEIKVICPKVTLCFIFDSTFYPLIKYSFRVVSYNGFIELIFQLSILFAQVPH